MNKCSIISTRYYLNNIEDDYIFDELKKKKYKNSCDSEIKIMKKKNLKIILIQL